MKQSPCDRINELTRRGFNPVDVIGEENLNYPTQEELEDNPTLAMNAEIHVQHDPKMKPVEWFNQDSAFPGMWDVPNVIEQVKQDVEKARKIEENEKLVAAYFKKNPEAKSLPRYWCEDLIPHEG